MSVVKSVKSDFSYKETHELYKNDLRNVDDILFINNRTKFSYFCCFFFILFL